MRVYIVAYNDGEYANQARLTEVTAPVEYLNKPIEERVFKTLEAAQNYVKERASTNKQEISFRWGSEGITIYVAEMDDEKEKRDKL